MSNKYLRSLRAKQQNKNPNAEFGGLFKELWEYSDTKAEASKRNESAWQHKLKIASEYKNAKPWPDSIPKKLSNVRKAYPRLTNISVPLGVAPNSEADAFAQGAIFAYLTAKMFDIHQFKNLGDSFVSKAMKSNQDIEDGPATRQAQLRVYKAWHGRAKETSLLPAWYNLPQQFKNMRTKSGVSAVILDKRIKQFSNEDEIKFSQGIAKDNQSSLSDLAYSMRGWIALATLAIGGVFLAPVIGPLLPTIGRVAGKGAIDTAKLAGKGVIGTAKLAGKGAIGTAKLIDKKMDESKEEKQKEKSIQDAVDKAMKENQIKKDSWKYSEVE